jgi:hypothetical protein
MAGSSLELAGYLAACDQALEQQAAELAHMGARLSLPMPRDTAQWEALKSWLKEFWRETGKTDPIEFYPLGL